MYKPVSPASRLIACLLALCAAASSAEEGCPTR